MKAAVFKGVGDMVLTERPDIEIAPGEAIVKVKYCGICGTDIHSYTTPGRRAGDMVLGHEVVGTVEEVGEGVDKFKKGDRVIIGPPGLCGDCYYCRHGYANLCSFALQRTIGISAGIDGGMAEYVRVRIPNTMLHIIPDEVSFQDAVLMDTIAVAFHGVRLSNFRIGNNAVVGGAGSIGLAAIQFLKIGGARHVTALQRSQMKRDMAKKYGADLTLNPEEEGAELPKKIQDLYGGIGADVAFECVGSPQSFTSLPPLLRRGGQLVVIGVTAEQPGITAQQMVRGEIDIKGSFVYDEEDIRLCLDFIAQGRFKTDGMVSEIIKLDDIVGKMESLAESTKDVVKVLVEP